jgi:hypothetical protein
MWFELYFDDFPVSFVRNVARERRRGDRPPTNKKNVM